MPVKIHFETVSPVLVDVLKFMMANEYFKDFRLVGGTALSLIRGHRISADIDLFADAEYGSVNFIAIENLLRNRYCYVDTLNIPGLGPGMSFYVGESNKACVKCDLYYTDRFIWTALEVDCIRMATVEEIIAMKLDVISRCGRKKDFWDIHEFITDYAYVEMLAFHQQRYPFAHDPEKINRGFANCNSADDDFEPVCLKGKYWELIKLDLLEFTRQL